MANIQFGHPNLYLAAVTALTASSEVTSLPVGATKHTDRSYVWRSATGTGTPSIDIDLGSVQAVSAVGAANVRLVGSGVLKLQERGDGSSPGSANDVATLDTQDATTRASFKTFASQSHRHWRLLWTNPTSASEYAELGFAYLGAPFVPTKNVQMPVTWQYHDPSILVPSVDGQLSASARTHYRTAVFRFLRMSQADRDTLADTLFVGAGRRTPMFMMLESTLSWSVLLARVASDLQADHALATLGQYSVEFDVEEAR